MVNVDIKSLLLHLNSLCTTALQNAAGLCVSRTHYEITVEHLIVKLLEEPRSDWPLIFQRFGLEVGQVQKALEQTLEEYKTGNAAKPVFSPQLLDLFQDAWLIASIDLEERKVRSGAILLAFLAKPALFSSGRYAESDQGDRPGGPDQGILRPDETLSRNGARSTRRWGSNRRGSGAGRRLFPHTFLR